MKERSTEGDQVDGCGLKLYLLCYKLKEIITVVIAPGPARGTTPDSPGRVLPPNLHTPWVNNSMAIMNRSTPPAIIKAEYGDSENTKNRCTTYCEHY